MFLSLSFSLSLSLSLFLSVRARVFARVGLSGGVYLKQRSGKDRDLTSASPSIAARVEADICHDTRTRTDTPAHAHAQTPRHTDAHTLFHICIHVCMCVHVHVYILDVYVSMRMPIGRREGGRERVRVCMRIYGDVWA